MVDEELGTPAARAVTAAIAAGLALVRAALSTAMSGDPGPLNEIKLTYAIAHARTHAGTYAAQYDIDEPAFLAALHAAYGYQQGPRVSTVNVERVDPADPLLDGSASAALVAAGSARMAEVTIGSKWRRRSGTDETVEVFTVFGVSSIYVAYEVVTAGSRYASVKPHWEFHQQYRRIV